MLALLVLHLAAALCAPLCVRWWGRNAFYVLAVAPIAAVVWALSHTRQAFTAPYTAEYRWVPTLDLTVSFRVDVLSWLMILIVAGVGTFVMIYAGRYFSAKASHLGRFSGVFVAFAGAMLGVVTVDNTIGLYMFWEFTTVLSYLLIGHHHDRAPARAAARQALLITSSGALAMFAGFVMLGQVKGGSYQISTLVENLQAGAVDLTSPLVIVAAVLVLLGAASKSALYPFYFWLPGAMAAPTPVSAYLHAAAMVKAGVYLVARLTPGFTLIPGWSPAVIVLGLVTMLVGAYRALRQYDLKLVLAYGTVSQLGLMTAAVGTGSAPAMAAGLTLLLAHSLFKSTLFLTVGAVESTTGTRDLRELSGLWRYRPVLAVAAGLAALSMAGVPFTLGYLGKEAFITALLHDGNIVVLVVVALGSMLTVAYAWRFWWGAFATKRLDVKLQLKPTSAGMTVPIVALSLGALLGAFPGTVSRVIDPIAESLPGHPHLALWSGWGPALITLGIFAGGLFLIWRRPAVAVLQRRLGTKFSLVRLYSQSVAELELFASWVTASIHRGSLPSDLSVIFVTLIAGAGYAIWRIGPPGTSLVWFDNLFQGAIVILAIVAAIVTVRARRRLKAVLALSAVGLFMTLLFATQGAPDLAITQLVVEAVTLVVFVLVLRKLPLYFSDRPLASSRWLRLGIAVAVGAIVTIGGWVATGARTHEPVSTLMPAEAFAFGNGKNIVNVILVDIRGWDTFGELSVLLVTATGVASLIYLQSRSGKIDRTPPELKQKADLLPAVATLRRRDRSVVLEVSTRALFPAMIVISIWLLLIGHNNPGGGFAGGIVAGLAFVLRYIAGGRYELGEAMPIPAGRLLGLGLFIAAIGGVLPLFFGSAVLQSVPVTVSLGFLGELHFTSAMILDIGVYVLVVGVVIDLVSALGAEIDRQSERARSRQKQGRR